MHESAIHPLFLSRSTDMISTQSILTLPKTALSGLKLDSPDICIYMPAHPEIDNIFSVTSDLLPYMYYIYIYILVHLWGSEFQLVAEVLSSQDY